MVILVVVNCYLDETIKKLMEVEVNRMVIIKVIIVKNDEIQQEKVVM